MTSSNKPIIIGKIGAPYGVKGWIKIFPNTEPFEAILDYLPWQIKTHRGQIEPLPIDDVKPHGKHLIAKIHGIETPEAARRYTNTQIVVNREQLPETAPDEYYWTDLEGLTVINKKGITLGKIDSLLETGANDVMVVIDEIHQKKRHLIPYIENKYVLQIDLKKGTMLVDWDEDF